MSNSVKIQPSISNHLFEKGTGSSVHVSTVVKTNHGDLKPGFDSSTWPFFYKHILYGQYQYFILDEDSRDSIFAQPNIKGSDHGL